MNTINAEFYTLKHNGLDYVIEVINGTTHVYAVRNGYQVNMNLLLTQTEIDWLLTKARNVA